MTDKIEIRHRWTDVVLFTWEADSDVTGLTVGEKLGRAVLEAVKARANPCTAANPCAAKSN